MTNEATRKRARARIGSILGGVILVGAVAACTPPTGGGSHPTSTTTTTVAAPTCAPKTEILGGYPSATDPIPGWYTSDTREHGAVSIGSTFGDPTQPAGLTCNAVIMTTGDATPDQQDKAQLLNYDHAGTALSASINDVSYSTYRSSTSGANPAEIAINIQFTQATAPVFGTLVFEPYVQPGGSTDDQWQNWNASDGLWWTSKILSGAGSQASPTTWDNIRSNFPTAVLAGVGLDLGANNPDIVAAADNLTVGSFHTDF